MQPLTFLMNFISKRSVLLSCILLGLNIMFFVFYFGPRVVDDSGSYLRLSYSLFVHGTYEYRENPFGNNLITGEGIAGNDTSFRAPLYPLIVYALWMMAGSTDVWIVLIFQSLALFASCAYLFHFLRRQIPGGAPWLSLSIAIFPAIGFYAVTLIADGLFWAVLLIMFCATYQALHEGTRSRWAWLCVWVIVSLYLRPVFIAFMPLLAVFTRYAYPTAFKRSLYAMLVVTCALIPWMMRNKLVEGHFNFVSESTRLISVKAHRSTLHYSLTDNIRYVKSYLFDYRARQSFSDLYNRFDHSAIYPEYAEQYSLQESMQTIIQHLPWFALMYVSEFITLHLPEYYYFQNDLWFSFILTLYYGIAYCGTALYVFLSYRNFDVLKFRQHYSLSAKCGTALGYPTDTTQHFSKNSAAGKELVPTEGRPNWFFTKRTELHLFGMLSLFYRFI